MRTPHITLSLGVLVGLLLTGTAHAGATTGATTGAVIGAPVPTGTKALTHNPLYRSGKLTLPCDRHPKGAGSVAAAKKHLTAISGCLNASWSKQLKKIGVMFRKPGIQFMTKPGTACGSEWGRYHTGRYCTDERQLVIMIGDYAVKAPADPVMLHLIAHEYAHHVQNLTGIWGAYEVMPADTESQALAQSRRLELQADCLGAVFMSSVWSSQNYRSEDWKEVVDHYRLSGDEKVNTKRSHGTGRNRAAWLQRGFAAASPSACNTWSAPASRVA
ncbi:neutral zinc metallopeptidase [Streptosporangium longisporum]|uniref:Metalloprotease n=1 Tax=Streptosporangium longisporum TaxID=46187 RepID=A0ABN3XXN2_9ACTN